MKDKYMGRIFADNRKGNMILLFLIISTIFLILYRKFIFGDSAYVFTDIGSDTMHQYFPFFVYNAEAFQSGNLLQYSLQAGLGDFNFTQIVALLNPLDFVLLLCNNETMYIGLMISLYLKIIITGGVSYLFFERIFQNRYSRLSCAILWAFSSYLVLWGQHYAFATNIVYFTLFMFVLQVYLEQHKFLNKWLPLVMFLFALRGYWLIFVAGIFGVIYICAYGFLKKYPIKYVLTKLCGLGVMAVCGLCMAAFNLFILLANVFGSTRLSAGSTTNILASLFDFYSYKYVATTLGRIISNDTMGLTEFGGWSNYYEAPMLFTSGLFVFSFVYFLFKKGKRQLWLYLIGMFCVLSSLITAIFNAFSGINRRWTFLLVFCMIIGIGYMLEHLCCGEAANEKCSKRRLVAFGGVALYGLMLGALVYCKKSGILQIVDKKVLVVSVVFVVIYMCFFLFYNGKRSRIIMIVFMTVVCTEMVIANNGAVNERQTWTKENSTVYQTDGTTELVDYMKQKDESLYRMNKTYHTIFYDDAFVQGYNGFSWYMSTIPESVISYMKSNQLPLLNESPNYVNIPSNRFVLNTLLGQKYLTADQGEAVPSAYVKVFENGKKVLYENQLALPFGYVYYQETQESKMQELSEQERDVVRTESFYYTESEDSKGTFSPWEREVEETIESFELMDHYKFAQNAEVLSTAEGMTVKGIAEDMQLYFDTPDGVLISEMSIEMNATTETTMQIFWKTAGDAFAEEKSKKINVTPGKATYRITFEELSSIDEIRLDPSTEAQEVLISQIQTIMVDPHLEEKSVENLQTLKSNSIQDVTFADNVLQGTVENKKQEVGMLCIPIFYHSNWTVLVDGEERTLENINGGLCGVEIPTGTHKVQLQYSNQALKIGTVVSVFAWLIYLCVFWDWKKILSKRNEKKHDQV